ncbi:MAG: hypothetical protein IV100_10880 [Myxococcales bacterium]|nr:hypothetical protein [Myxococcales bacterium]
MVQLKDAVTAALRFVSDVFSEESPQNLRLEEVELAKGGHEWRVTVGFDRQVERRGPTAAVLQTLQGPQFERVYKVVRVDAGSGEPKAIVMRADA